VQATIRAPPGKGPVAIVCGGLDSFGGGSLMARAYNVIDPDGHLPALRFYGLCNASPE